MSGKRAKQLRKKVYGKEFSPRHREYRQNNAGTIYCVGKRAEYQKLKKELKA